MCASRLLHLFSACLLSDAAQDMCVCVCMCMCIRTERLSAHKHACCRFVRETASVEAIDLLDE